MSDRTVLVCDDHPIFRRGVVNIIRSIKGFEVIGEASDADFAIAKLQIYSPDVLVTDISLPRKSGFEILKWVHEHMARVKVIVLSMHSELAFIEKAKRLGAVAYIAKEDASGELFEALLQNGTNFFTSQSAGMAQAGDPVERASAGMQLDLANISPAELRVLVLLSESKTSREIAAQLNISHRTVDSHRHRLAEKLDARGPNKLLQLAIRHGDQIRRS